MSRSLTRRAWLAGGLCGCAGLAGYLHLRSTTATPRASSLIGLTAVEAVGAMRRGELRAEAYAEALLARAQQCQELHLFISLAPEAVLQAARDADRQRASGAALGPLHGLPIPVKDSVNTKDLPTTGGTPALREFRPRDDAEIVKVLRRAGALVMGKTNLHELSFGWTSNNLAFGAVHNPYDRRRSPGGSSGGTAAAVAARVAPLGLAEDTQGSLRVPAALCGIAGFRPTTGRYPTTGVVPITPLFDQVGPQARTVGDLILFDSVAANDASSIPDVLLRGARLGIDRSYFEGLDPEVERITNDALKALAAAGVVVIEAPVPELVRLLGLTTGQVVMHDVEPALRRYLAESGARIGYEELIAAASPDIQRIFQSFVPAGAPLHVTSSSYEAARDVHLPALRGVFRQWFADTGAEAMVFPTVRIAATPIGQEVIDIRGERVPFNGAVRRNIASGSTAGLPGLVLPSGLTKSGLPVSLELDGPVGSDRRLLALGLAIERLLGRLPPAP